MKFLASTILMMGFTMTALSADTIASNGVVFSDKGSLEISLVRFGPEKDQTYLAKVSGVDSDLNGKVILLTASGGVTGPTYYARDNGKNLLRAPAHDYFGWEAYFGSKTYKISMDKEATKKLATETLLKEYKNQK